MRKGIKKRLVKVLLIVITLLIILFTFLNLVAINKINVTDSLAHYMFSHAIRIGELPYNDFNIITTPLYTFITSIGLFIYDDYIVFLIENIIMIIIIIILMYKLLKESIIYYLPILLICSIILFSLFPTYNLLCILLLLLLMILEKDNKSDKLIGFIIGLIILTKHTIGLCILIVGLLLVIKNKKRIINRLIGISIPLFIFLIYLLITKSLYNFINLTILGLFDFSNNNGNYLKPLSIIGYVLIIISILLIIKYKNKKYNKTSLYYSIASISFSIPIFDPYHLSLFLTVYFIFIILFFKDNKIIKLNKDYLKIVNIIHYSFFLLLFVSLVISLNDYYKNYYSKKIYKPRLNHLKTSIMVGKDYYDKFNNLNSKYVYYNKKSNAIMLGQFSNLVNIINEKEITYFDVMLYGNLGYNSKMKTNELINELKDTYIFIQRNHTKKSTDVYSQYYYPIYKYIKDNYKLVDYTDEYDIYYKK